ncbi:amidohydrolase family protein [Chloroflexota bacterium]
MTPEQLVSLASKNPGRIIPAVRTKVRRNEDSYELLEKQVNIDGFGAMAEVLMYHVPIKLIEVHLDDERVQTALKYALDKEWPFIVHIEFAMPGCPYDEFMTELKTLLAQYPEHPFVLIHMGQLDNAAVQQLIEAYDNIYFITSASVPPPIAKVDHPWTNMFDGRNLSADWKQLMIQHPDRFILGFDMVLADMWGRLYLYTVAIWREAIKELPVEVAHAFAHGNAERLWHLPSVE